MNIIQSLPVYSLYKILQKMEKDNLYEFKKVGKNVEVMNIPEGKIYMIDTEGNGSGKRPIFVPKNSTTDTKEDTIKTVKEEDKKEDKVEDKKSTKTTKK